MKRSRIYVIFLFCLSLMALAAGCRSEKKTIDQGKKKGTAVYYTNKDCTRLVEKRKELKLVGKQEKQVKTLLAQMRKVETDKKKYKSAIPGRVVISHVSVSSNIVSVDFSSGYKRIEENEDLICRAGIVYTLTQIKGINYVSFSISGKPMLDTDGTALGALGQDSFVFGELPMK